MSRLHMGIDVGSTTVKVVVLDENNNTLFAEYRRHFSDIKSTVKGLFAEVKEVVKNEQFTVVITGSGGLLLSKMLDLPFVQEVIANKTAIKHLCLKQMLLSNLAVRMQKSFIFRADLSKE